MLNCGHMQIFEQHGRSLIKALTFRVLIILADSVVVYAITGRFDMTATFVIISNVSSTVLYYIHERIWNRINWGKRRA
jgi:uncharacterized membrane protein